MRILSLPIDDDLLEVHNSHWTGEEKIYFNGTLTSSGCSFFGKNHYFTVDAPDGNGVDKYRVEVGMNWYGGFSVDVFRNDRCLLASNRTPLTRVDQRLQPNADAQPFHLSRPNSPNTTLDEDFLV